MLEYDTIIKIIIQIYLKQGQSHDKQEQTVYPELTVIAAPPSRGRIWHHLGIATVVLLSPPPFLQSAPFFSFLFYSTVVLISVPPFLRSTSTPLC